MSTNQPAHRRIGIKEAFGLDPLSERLRDLKLTLLGDDSLPRSRFDLTSLRVFQPWLGVRTWLGWKRPDGLVPIANLYNHTQTPPEEGWSVRVTQVRDFRGGDLTYDSHNGTDFVVPVGTVVRAAAPGRVLRISNEFNRGGLKILVDHGRGLVTGCNHLARALVRTGDLVERGAPIALSGYSGIDAVISFPWVSPHVHFNVWLDGVHTDPFAEHSEESLWRRGNEPTPDDGTGSDGEYIPADWDEDAIAETIASCRDRALREELERTEPLERRAVDVLFNASYYPTRFESRPLLYRTRHPRAPWLDLPLGPGFRGITIPTRRRIR